MSADEKKYSLKDTNRELLSFPSPAEYEVLRLVAQGLGNKEIARERGNALMTIKKHIRVLFLKLNVVDRKELVAEAKRRGLI